MAEFFLDNPFYLHHYEGHFKENLDLISESRLAPAKQKLINYIEQLKQDEDSVMNSIIGDRVDKNKALTLLLRDTFDVKPALNLLDEIFNKEAGAISFGNTKGDSTYYARIPGSKIELIKTGERSNRGRIENIYDYKASVENADNLEEFKQQLKIFVDGIKKAINKYESIEEEMKRLLDFNVLTNADGKVGTWESVKEFLDGVNSYENTPTEEFLEFLRRCIGKYSTLVGKFSEGARAVFSKEVQDIFGEDLQKLRGDQFTGKNKKPDVIITGGTITLENNPITISQKAGSDAALKIQSSSIYNLRENFYKLEDKDISNIFLYLVLNDAFYNNDDAIKKINLINKYFSYVLFSGLSGDNRIDRALYLVYSSKKGKDVITKFIPMSSILEAILNDSSNPIEMEKQRIEGTKEEMEQIFNAKKIAEQRNKDIKSLAAFSGRQINESEYETEEGVIKKINPLQIERQLKIKKTYINKLKQGIILYE